MTPKAGGKLTSVKWAITHLCRWNRHICEEGFHGTSEVALGVSASENFGE